MKKRAWKDARQDYYYEKATIKRGKGSAAWKLFVALLLSGAVYRFFGG